ncbi:hypothetical protein TPL01_25050 [Sulfuriferula plumbiphila]|uniref:Uncharacterized protein n=1 Tax=Sulfuriferula plumbiphila TaxID=171865 RepID=A0A512LA58_9PROT|nr:hypothetical protein [Sulfuriferula plumbiphila]BBP03067.1 hypothetical protein SFPGR_04890 [Sulfuriferula plumbiphila]GEP31367.1 hypothetical protein TPL01_25050 [Sulfuriferula plumbiphila]
MKAQYVRNAAIALIAGLGLMATPLYAEMPGGKDMGKGMMGDQKGGMTQMSSMMHDTADTMMLMSGEIGKGDMNAARQKQMSERMREMSIMMDDMSGMIGKGMMMDAEQQKKMSEMRKQVDAMHKDAAAGTGTKKPAPHLHPRDGK